MTETIQKEYVDSVRQMNQESLDQLARDIHERHQRVQSRVESLRTEAGDICSESIQIAKEVEIAHATLGGKRFLEWWNDQKLPVGWAKRYLTLAQTCERHTLGDKDQMRLIGILPEAETHNDCHERRADDGLDFIKHTGKIRASLTDERIKRMGKSELIVALKQLEPIHEVYVKLKRLSGTSNGI